MRTDFNTDLEKIDQAIFVCDYVFGTYEGTSPRGQTITQTIDLGFRARAVLIFPNRQRTNGAQAYALAFDGQANNGVTITDTGFTIQDATNFTTGYTDDDLEVNPYRYMAFR